MLLSLRTPRIKCFFVCSLEDYRSLMFYKSQTDGGALEVKLLE